MLQEDRAFLGAVHLQSERGGQPRYGGPRDKER